MDKLDPRLVERVAEIIAKAIMADIIDARLGSDIYAKEIINEKETSDIP